MSDLVFKLGAAMLLAEQELMRLVKSAPRRYKVFNIPKRTPGQFREIAQPAREVKALQYWVMNNVLCQFPVHPSAIGYQPGKNIADNARPHLDSRFLLKLDFKDFFPSIKARDFKVFVEKKQLGLSDSDIEILSRILFWKPKKSNEMRLSIGAPSSPLLSNILLADFDEQVSTFCLQEGVAYTRYADDLSFSADLSSKLQQTEKMVKACCRDLGTPTLRINPEKTVRVSKKNSRRVTGLVISNDARVSLGRDQKRVIRSSVHHFVTGKLSRDQVIELRGMLAYVNSVEPDFLARLREKYGSATIQSLQSVK